MDLASFKLLLELGKWMQVKKNQKTCKNSLGITSLLRLSGTGGLVWPSVALAP